MRWPGLTLGDRLEWQGRVVMVVDFDRAHVIVSWREDDGRIKEMTVPCWRVVNFKDKR